MSKRIPLTQNKFSMVDDADYDRVSVYKWYFCKKSKNKSTGYAIHDFNGNKEIIESFGARHIPLHRFILETPKGMDTDHINRDRLDNRRSNLRVCTRSQNMANTKKRIDSGNKYKGIEKSSCSERWFARIKVNKKRIYIGCFKTPSEAAHAYDNAARNYFGQFSNTNYL